MSTVSWSDATWYKVNVASPKRYSSSGGRIGSGFQTKPRKHLSLDEWIATKAGRVFFLPGEDWSAYNYQVNDYEARSAMVPAGDKPDEYLTGTEYVRMWDHLTSFDSKDLVRAGADFTAYSKVFKVICAHEQLFEDIERAIQNMWSAQKVKLKMTKDLIDSQFSYVYDKSTLNKDEKFRGAQSIVFSRDLKKRYDLISAALGNSDDSTEIFRLVMASLLLRPDAFDGEFVSLVAGLGERHGGKAVFEMVVDGLDFEVIGLMLDYGIDRELATATVSS